MEKVGLVGLHDFKTVIMEVLQQMMSFDLGILEQSSWGLQKGH